MIRLAGLELKPGFGPVAYEGMGYREIEVVPGCLERGVETRLTQARMRAERG